MLNRTTLQLVEAIDWRNKTVRYLNLFMGCDMGEPEAEEIRTCMGMMTLEIENILAQTDGFTLRGREKDGPWSN